MHHLPFSFKSIVVVLAAMIATGFYVGHKTRKCARPRLISTSRLLKLEYNPSTTPEPLPFPQLS